MNSDMKYTRLLSFSKYIWVQGACIGTCCCSNRRTKVSIHDGFENKKVFPAVCVDDDY